MGYPDKTEEEIINSPSRKSKMKCIRCPECGEEILMVPTLKKMIEAIENHVSTHKKQPSVEIDAPTLKPGLIRTDLTEQVLEQASETLEVSQKPPLWLQRE
jgi:DNA-directed RNA polymerase subunit RPC12/RpoP